MHAVNPIRLATIERCCEEQNDAAIAAYHATFYRLNNQFGRAAQEQREAAYHYKQMWERLARLIGVA